MTRLISRDSLFPRVLILATLIAFASAWIAPNIVMGQTAGDEGSTAISKFDEVIKLKVDGEYDQAIDMLQEIITEYSNSELVLRRAYNHLVAIHHEKGDTGSAVRTAREALERYPDLTAEQDWFLPAINDYYDQLRKEMFGSLTIEDPKDCRVFLNSEHVGTTPLHLALVRAGEYDLTLAKSGHHDYTGRVLIRLGVSLKENVSLKRKRGKWWWLTRSAGAVVAVVALAVGLSGGDEPVEPPPDPLPPPPDPPTN